MKSTSCCQNLCIDSSFFLRIRGALGSIVTITFNAGLLSGFILASHLSYSLYPRIIIGLAIVYIFAIYSLPETPQYLIKNKRNDEAENALRFYRSFEASNEEERQKFKEDLTIQKDTKNGDMGKKVNVSYRDFCEYFNYVPYMHTDFFV